jgi:hypothetical protein
MPFEFGDRLSDECFEAHLAVMGCVHADALFPDAGS